MYTRNCPSCNKELNYSYKGNLKKAERDNKICRSCSMKLRNDNPEYLKKISDGRKKYFKELSDEERKAWIKKNSEAQKEVWKNRSEEYMDDWKKSVSITTKKRWSDKERRNKWVKALKDNSWTTGKTDEEIARIMQKQTKTKYDKYGTLFPRERKIVVNGLICESSSELKYIESLISENKELPKNADPILTPLGYYTPDFEYEDRFIEIKCEFTYKVLMGEKSFSKKTKTDLTQFNKIKWVSENLKKVEIIIM